MMLDRMSEHKEQWVNHYLYQAYFLNVDLLFRSINKAGLT